MFDIHPALPSTITVCFEATEGADGFFALGGRRREAWKGIRAIEIPNGDGKGLAAALDRSEAPPPNVNLDAECEVLRAVFWDPARFVDVVGLEPHHFYEPALGELFRAGRECAALGVSTIGRGLMSKMIGATNFVGERLKGLPTLRDTYNALMSRPSSLDVEALTAVARELVRLAGMRELARLVNTGQPVSEIAVVLDELQVLSSPGLILRHPLHDRRPIEERRWIAPKFLMRGEVTLLVGPPGTGKSTLIIQSAYALSIGVSWGAVQIAKPFRVLLLHVEDDDSESDRKLAACREAMPGAFVKADNLATLCSDEEPILARFDERAKEIAPTAAFARLEALTKEHSADVLIVDPISGIYEGDETNPAFKALARLFRKLARRCNCAVALIHHTRKGADDMAGNLDASRGGSTLAGRVRVGLTIFSMSEDEAKLHGIDPAERRRYARLDDAKQSYGSISGSGAWFKIEPTIIFTNDDPPRPVEVATFRPWQPGGVFEGIDNRTIHAILAEIDIGVVGEDGQPTGDLFQPRQDASHWAGEVIMRHVPGCLSARATAILATWKQSRLVVETEFTTQRHRKPRIGLKSVPARWPGAVS
jgi:hypothetical protein